MSVILKSRECYVNAWVLRRPAEFQAAMLHHEQGHYDLVALFCRDMFIDLMALKTQTFPSAQQVIQQVRRILDRYDDLIEGIHALYDRATLHSRNPQQQRRWDGFIQTAFTRSRPSGAHAPDGTPYKIPLATVLRSAGVAI